MNDEQMKSTGRLVGKSSTFELLRRESLSRKFFLPGCKLHGYILLDGNKTS